MGASITIDKYSTGVDEWLQIQSRLNEVEFDAPVSSHFAVWKVCAEERTRQITVVPVDLDISTHSVQVSDEDSYVVSFVKHRQLEVYSEVGTHAYNLLLSVLENVQMASYKNYMSMNAVDEFQCYTYCLIGNRAVGKVKMVALSYSVKLPQLYNSLEKLKVMTGGGVLKHKKLQMGSLLHLHENSSVWHSLASFQDIHFISLISPPTAPLAILAYQPKVPIPCIQINNLHSHVRQPIQIPSLKVPQKNVKPPMLKLVLKPYQEVTYEQIAEEQKEGVMKYDIRATARHELKMEKFRNACTKIIDGLYVSGEKVAKDLESLRKHEITQVVNCAGDYCYNWFEKGGQINYLTFFLKDSQNENIECLFYQVIDFINSAHRNKRNVLIHCIQGISRSVTFAIAYLIFINGYDYKKAENFVKQKRAIACPNNGFMVELIQFYKRLYEDYSALPSPRAFLVSSHCSETPSIVTARMLKHSLFDQRKFTGLDCRGIYIIHCEEVVYLWVGHRCEGQDLNRYWTHAQNYIKRLQDHERAPKKLKAVNQHSEGREFLSLWGLTHLDDNYQNPEYDRLFPEPLKEPAKPGYLRKYYQRDDEVVEECVERLFIYPDHQNGLGVFEFEDLSEFCLLVRSDEEALKIFVWKGGSWVTDEERQQQFLDRVICENYGSYDSEKIEVIEEDVDQPSENFLNSFS